MPIAAVTAALSLGAGSATRAQTGGPRPAAGVELMGYPAGFIAALRLDFPIAAGRYQLQVTGGYNLTDRRDWGRHDDEDGGGLGLGLGVQRWFRRESRGWFVGARTELWFLDIDWSDRVVEIVPDGQGRRRGNTDVTVLQPTGRAGYAWLFNDGRLRLEAGMGLGVEINARTRGEAVGHGAILLAGAALSLRF